MKKTSNMLGLISLFFAILLGIAFVDYIIYSSSPDSSVWAETRLGITLIIFFFILVILSIPFVVLLFMLKFKNMKFYAFSHLIFILLFGLSVLLFSSQIFYSEPIEEEYTIVVLSACPYKL